MKHLSYVCLVLLLFFSSPDINSQVVQCQNRHEINLATDLPLGYNILFSGSGECLLCHNSMTDAQGKSIGILDDWRSTMMANAAKDPFWRAKVSHETLVNPMHAEALENICTKCHSPLGNFNAHHLGEAFYSIAEMEGDSISMDGVSCTLCHQIRTETFGTFSANLVIDTNKTIFGPYPSPFQNPMINHTGYTPTYSDHIKSSRICGSCHTLITSSVDMDGNPTGETFVEQAIYHEWLNSIYPGNDQSCKTCHIPEISDVVKISTMPPWLDGRTPFGKHHMSGANVFMYKILSDNIQSLGITAEPQHFDSTISRTYNMLQKLALTIELTETNRTPDSIYLELKLQNMTGHKFPSGFPSRRVFVEIIAWDETGDTLLHSGKLNDDYTLAGENISYEKHHSRISNDDDVQIYEMVFVNVNGEVTTVLAQAAEPLKDNRIPPVGFSSNHDTYDTVQIAGMALSDENFNKHNGTEGSGQDIIEIHIPMYGSEGDAHIQAKVYYQTTSPKWLNEMFSYASPEIDLWKELYQNSNREPILIAEKLHLSIATSTKKLEEEEFIIYPIPAKETFYIKIPESEELTSGDIYSLKGDRLASIDFSNNLREIKLSGKKGIFVIKLTTSSNQHIIRKVVLN